MNELTQILDADTARVLADVAAVGIDRSADGHVFQGLLFAATQNVILENQRVALKPDLFAEKVWYQVAALIKAGIATRLAAKKVL